MPSEDYLRSIGTMDPRPELKPKVRRRADGSVERTDCHRPSVIVPSDYEVLGYAYFGPSAEVEEALTLEMTTTFEEIEARGLKESTHPHNGGCGICGAAAHYVAALHHKPSGTFIWCGSTCAHYINMDEGGFKRIRKHAADARQFATGKRKAARLLREWGLDGHFARRFEDHDLARVLFDMWRRLVRYGDLSEKQREFARKIPTMIDKDRARRAEWAKQRAVEALTAEPAPAGRVVVLGTVAKTDTIEYENGDCRYVMLVKDDRGFRVWGTQPGSLDCAKGDRVQFRATLEPKADDKLFAFFKRPTNAVLVQEG